jgi:hypothetical protein
VFKEKGLKLGHSTVLAMIALTLNASFSLSTFFSTILSYFLVFQPVNPANATFVTRKVMDGKVSINLPSTYKPLTETEMKQRFQNQRLPKTVWGDNKGVAGVVVDLMPMALTEADLLPYVKETEKQFKTMYNTCTIYSSGTRLVNGRKMGWVELEYSVPNGKMYNYMAFFPLAGGGNPLMVGFSTDAQGRTAWKPHIGKIINSVKILK